MPLNIQGSSNVPLELDANLVNGQTYTFQFKCNNWFCVTDLSQTIQNDIIAQAPNFLTSVQVTSPTSGGWFAATTALYNVQFTYEGDGSDVMSDVAASIVAAVLAVSNDNIVLIGGVAASAAAITVSPSQAVAITAQAVKTGAQNVASGVGDVAAGVANAAAKPVNAALVGILPVLIVAVALIMFVLPSFTKSATQLRG